MPKRPDTCPECGYETDMLHHDERAYSCFSCGYVFYVDCPLCGGEGFMAENEMECDWVNYDDEIATCRECNGEGVTSNPSFQ